ncbi:MAG: peroxiredoxin [Deltaproteobacteria bacterium]|nr:peroxiredoxin [Deltaproteobacteria bacterium]
MIEIGQPAPDFTARTTDGKTISLGDYRGTYLVLYFYPKAFTPGCTRQAVRFRDSYPDIKALGAEVIGVSTDDHQTQCDFAAKYTVSFPMIGDRTQAISRAYQVLGKILPGDRRITFIIDPNGTVVERYESMFQISKHLDKVLEFLRAHQPAKG